MKRISIIIFLIILPIILTNDRHHRVKRIVGGRAAAQPPPDDPVIFARVYNRDARVEGFRNHLTGLYSFLGIRYAEPPIGQNRFIRPLYRRLEGDLNATRYGPPCPQPDPYNPNRIVGNEDCLLLNVFTPRMPDESSGLPVYVWIHGGGFRYGSASQYGAEPLTQKGIIFVPVQYRLGTLGIIGDSNKDFSGNLAMFDMAAALRWVTEYISFFGGDPKQIKVIGHGSGAASAMYMSTSRIPRSGSINGVVSMSGSALSQYATDTEPVQSLEEIATINECPTTNETEIVKCMRNKTVEEIISKDSLVQTERLQGRAMIKGIAGGAGYNPHIESPDDNRALPGFITEEPEETLKQGSFRKIPLLIGVTKHETGNGLTLSTITKVFGSVEKFLVSLIGSLDKLKSFLQIDQITGEILKPVLPGLEQLGMSLTDYLKIPESISPAEILGKLTESTTDVLFNLPAVLSAEVWGKVAPSFLYSFEYSGGPLSGIDFLRGLPIVSGERNKSISGHGDELGFLFEVNDLFGNRIENNELKSKNDLKVRDSFTSFLAKFAYMDVQTKTGGDNIFQSFIGKGSPFIKITDKIETGSDFRFCQLSLWGANLQPLTSTTCKGLLDGLGGTLTDLTGGLTNTLGTVLGGGGGGASGDKKKPNNGNIGGGILGTGILG